MQFPVALESPMPDLTANFPRALASQVRMVSLGPGRIPAMLAHPDWTSPAPVVIWLHGRTVRKETDPGRYLRWIRAGLAACAVDLPGHGERFEADLHSPARTLELVAGAASEIDHIVEALASREYEGVLDLDRVALGGMSAGGMATLRRLCDPHPFMCAAVEATSGSLLDMYHAPGSSLPRHPVEKIAPLDPMQHLDSWRPIPLLAMHTRADRLVPVGAQERFIEALRRHYASHDADPSLVEFVTWDATGAPEEHAGFGRFANDAKNAQVEFLARHLRAKPRYD